MRFYLIALILLNLFTGCERSSPHQGIANSLKAMPDRDKEALNAFFQLLVCDFDCAYTLFGNKPISVACYGFNVNSFNRLNSWELYHPSEVLTFEKGWEVWEKYASLFPSHQFALKRTLDDRGVRSIFLINKKQALKTIKDNLATFQEILGPFDSQDLLAKLCDSPQDISEMLNDNSTLFGTLLGYGKGNAMDFDNKWHLCQNLNAKMTPPFSALHDIQSLLPESQHLVDCFDNRTFSQPSTCCFPSSQEVSLAENLNEILSNSIAFKVHGSDFLLDKVQAPVFAARQGTLETQRLQEEYLATRQHLQQIYLEGSFLETTLKQWVHSP